MKINAERLTEARRRGHVSLRAVGRASGVTSFAVDRLEKTGDATNVAFGILEAIARASGLPLHDLVCEPDADPEDADVQAVLAALLGSPHGIVMDALTDALNLDAGRVREIVDQLRTAVRPAGLAVSLVDDTVRLAALHHHVPVDRGRLAAATQRARGRRSTNHTEANIIRDVAHGTTDPGAVRSDGNRNLRTNSLIRSEILTEIAGRIELSDDARFSLMLDE